MRLSRIIVLLLGCAPMSLAKQQSIPAGYNRLVHEKSPYLKQHSRNPVDWFPWGEEAFKKAREENRPIFVSIGYSTCHWCHVMERESFEDPAIAKVLNSSFVSIKVDREERPDVDAIYMNAILAMGESGGWPLNVFLTPTLKPFFGGTYFPREDSHGKQGFAKVLSFIGNLWKEKRGEIETNAGNLARALSTAGSATVTGTLSYSLLDRFDQTMLERYDRMNGGFSPAPKFPRPMVLSLLLREWLRTRNKDLLAMASETLRAMAKGGIHDQLGGGFHRYATDRRWDIPHFEKMLYDNALLAQAYTEAHMITQDPGFKSVARKTLDYLLAEMLSPDGAFFSATDADSAGEEGLYYTWTPGEIEVVLGEPDARIFCDRYGVTTAGNFEKGRSTLCLRETSGDLARKHGQPEARITALLEGAGEKLRQVRRKRIPPARDDKILMAWNALAVSALARAAMAFGEERYGAAAKRCLEFLLTRMKDGDTLYRRFIDGEKKHPATLEDHAALLNACVDVYEETLDPRWMEPARSLAVLIRKRFSSSGGGGFYSQEARPDLVVRVKDLEDGATPSGSSLAYLGLLRLAQITTDDALGESIRKELGGLAGALDQYPQAFPSMLLAVDFLLSPVDQIVLTGTRSDPGFRALTEVVRRAFLPRRIVLHADPGLSLPILEHKVPREGRPTVYVCRGTVCHLPVTTREALVAELGHPPSSP